MIYENDQDRANETWVLEFLKPRWELKSYRKLEMPYGVDYAMCKEEARFPSIWKFAEVKCRPDMTFGQYPEGYFLSLQKVLRAREILYETGKGCPLVVRFKGDAVYCCGSIFDHLPGSVLAGRWDRPDDPNAIEPHVVYPWEAFRQLK